MTNYALKINQLSIKLDSITVIDQLGLNVQSGRSIAILGRSGCGKTTFLKSIAGLLQEDKKAFVSGYIESPHQPLTQRIAYLEQTGSLLPWLTTLDNVLLPLTLAGQTIGNEDRKTALNLLYSVNLDRCTNRYPHQLSGGMRQRTALARTLIQNKPIIFLDEPFAALDAITRIDLLELCKTLLKNKTVIMVTHDINEAISFADEVYILHNQKKNLQKANTTPSQDSLTQQNIIFNQLKDNTQAA